MWPSAVKKQATQCVSGEKRLAVSRDPSPRSRRAKQGKTAGQRPKVTIPVVLYQFPLTHSLKRIAPPIYLGTRDSGVFFLIAFIRKIWYYYVSFTFDMMDRENLDGVFFDGHSSLAYARPFAIPVHAYRSMCVVVFVLFSLKT